MKKILFLLMLLNLLLLAACGKENCSVDGCKNEVTANGMCDAHNQLENQTEEEIETEENETESAGASVEYTVCGLSFALPDIWEAEKLTDTSGRWEKGEWGSYISVSYLEEDTTEKLADFNAFANEIYESFLAAGDKTKIKYEVYDINGYPAFDIRLKENGEYKYVDGLLEIVTPQGRFVVGGTGPTAENGDQEAFDKEYDAFVKSLSLTNPGDTTTSTSQEKSESIFEKYYDLENGTVIYSFFNDEKTGKIGLNLSASGIPKEHISSVMSAFNIIALELKDKLNSSQYAGCGITIISDDVTLMKDSISNTSFCLENNEIASYDEVMDKCITEYEFNSEVFDEISNDWTTFLEEFNNKIESGEISL